MKNKSKFLLVLSLILLVFFVRTVLDAYAKYANAAVKGVSGDFDTWYIEVNNQDIVDKNGKVINLNTLDDDGNDSVFIFSDSDSEILFPADVLSPGNFGYFELTIDYSDVTVPFVYNILAESNSTNPNIIDCIKIVEDGETEAETKAFVTSIYDSPISINNPLGGKVSVEETNRVMKVRIYVLWKTISSDDDENDEDIESSDYIDNLTMNEGIDYSIKLFFRQDTSMTDPEEPEPVVKEYGFEIEDRTNIDDIDGDGRISKGDIVRLGSEEFYVMKTYEDSMSVQMLAKYNLNIKTDDGTLGDSNVQYDCADNLCSLPFIVDEESIFAYWTGVVFNNSALYVYSDKSNLYKYVANYESILKNMGYNVARVNIPSYMDIGSVCNSEVKSCNSPNWLFSTSYWTGSASHHFNLWAVESGGRHGKRVTDKAMANRGNIYGVRPQVFMNVKDIY